ncbi:DUF3352 domain-containing protein [Leptolyngbya sp. AN02str]|uniref:DUF3352 domain-containing protein n=1 Tax=Leptolyngbya sp. AN02str TaxID=3423363 RepID=UPI003D323BD2
MKKRRKQQNRRFIAVVVGGAAIALIAGGFIGYLLSDRQGVGDVKMPPGADVLPQDVVMAVSVATDTTQWRRLRALGTPASRAQLEAQVARWRDRFFTQNGVDYQQTIAPWVGSEMTLAMLPLPDDAAVEAPTPPPTAETPDAEDDAAPTEETAPTDNFLALNAQRPMVMVLPIADVEQAQQRLAQIAPGNSPPQTREYKGIEVREFTGVGDRTTAAAVIEDRYVVLATESQAIDQVIDHYRGAPPLEQVPTYREAFRDIATSQSVARIYLNGPQVKQLVSENSAQPAPLLGLSPIQRNQGVALNIALEPEGLRIRGMGWLPVDSDYRYSVANRAGELLSLLPSDTLMVAAGGNLKEFWESYSQLPVVNPRNPFNPNTLQEGLLATTGLNLNQDLLSWMDGEFAIALVPVNAGTPEAQTGFVVAVESSDRANAENTLKRLDDTMGNRYRYQVSAAEVSGQPVVNWVSPFGSLSVTHGWLNQRTAFLALGASMVNTLLPTPQTPLASSELVETTRSPDLQANNGQFFVDLERLRASGDALPLPQLPPEADALWEAMRRIGVTAAIRSDRTTHFDIRILMQRRGNAS